jgi:hypothetical protein
MDYTLALSDKDLYFWNSQNGELFKPGLTKDPRG